MKRLELVQEFRLKSPTASVRRDADTPALFTQIRQPTTNFLVVPEVSNDLLNRGVAVHILNMGLIDNTPTGKLIVHIMLAFAEYERDLIIERTQAGKEIARSKNGFHDGRHPIDQKKKDFAVDLIVNQNKTYREVVELTGLSKSTLIRAVNAHKAKIALEEKCLAGMV